MKSRASLDSEEGDQDVRLASEIVSKSVNIVLNVAALNISRQVARSRETKKGCPRGTQGNQRSSVPNRF